MATSTAHTVQLKDLPRYLPQAVLATEDRRFYSHFGLDPIGLARAAYVNLRRLAAESRAAAPSPSSSPRTYS